MHRAAVKYGRAIAHVSLLYQHLVQVSDNRSWEVEVSVDETETPTTPAEHVFWARELTRLGVHWVSLAPRFVGTFEKGVDYIGDLTAFAQDVALHAAIARAYGPYKLSLHSGSDKFSIYDICVEATRGLVHLKTAGTSYLEALRTIGELDPPLLREIYAFACQHYEADRVELSRLSTPGSRPRSSEARLRCRRFTRAVRCARDLACDVRLGADGAERGGSIPLPR